MQWPKREAKFWEEIPFLRLLLPFVAGIALYDAFPDAGNAMGLAVMSAALFIALVAMSSVRRLGAWYFTFRFLTLVSFMAVCGYLLGFSSNVRHNENWIGHQPSGKGTLVVQVNHPPKATAKTWRLEAEALYLLDSLVQKQVCGGLILSVYKTDSVCPYQLDDTLAVAHKLQPHSLPDNPFGFNGRRFYGRRNNYFQQFVGENEILVAGRSAEAQKGFIRKMNEWAMRTLNRNVADTQTRALLQAMLLGNEADFDPDIRQTYADTGVIHVVAISGSHLATLFLVFAFIPLLVRGRRGQQLRYFLGLIAVWVYVMLAGAPPSAVRAAVVFTMLAGSILLDIRHHTINTLLAGVFFILCFRPMWLYEVGFQLSVMAVLSIVLLYPHVRRLVAIRNPVLRLVWQALAVSFCAQVLVAPLSIYYFHNFPVLFLIANLAAWLLIGLIAMFGGIAVLAFSWAPALSKGIADITAFFVHQFNGFVKFVQRLNPESFSHIQLSFEEMLLLYLLLGAAAVWLIHKSRKAFFVTGISVVMLLGISIHNRYKSLQNDLLVVYHTPGHTVADRIVGSGYTPVFQDTAGAAFKVVKAARTGYRAWRKNANTDTAFVRRIAGKTVLVYADSASRFDAPLGFGVDVLLIARPLKGLSATQLKAAFHPKMIVAGGLDKRWRMQAWKDSCAAIGQPFHPTGLDGAFVLR